MSAACVMCDVQRAALSHAAAHTGTAHTQRRARLGAGGTKRVMRCCRSCCSRRSSHRARPCVQRACVRGVQGDAHVAMPCTPARPTHGCAPSCCSSCSSFSSRQPHTTCAHAHTRAHTHASNPRLQHKHARTHAHTNTRSVHAPFCRGPAPPFAAPPLPLPPPCQRVRLPAQQGRPASTQPCLACVCVCICECVGTGVGVFVDVSGVCWRAHDNTHTHDACHGAEQAHV